VCFGLRISERLALKWAGVHWFNSRLYIRRGIVRQRVGETKTEYSNRPLVIDGAMLEVLKAWKQGSEFSGLDDWMLASPAPIGRLPWSMHDEKVRCSGDSYLEELKAEAARVRVRALGNFRIVICSNFNGEADTMEAATKRRRGPAKP
jgi:hypothetical protein